MTTPVEAQEVPDQPVAEWQYRMWWNGDGGEPMGWGDWQKVKPRSRLSTVDDMVAELRGYIAKGHRYELRPLFTRPTPAAADLHQQYVYVRLIRPEGYEDVHPELLVADAHIHPAFEPEIVAASPAAAAWNPTDDELAAIYKRANGEDTGKAKPLFTANIFKAMRAMLAASPVAPVGAPTEEREAFEAALGEPLKLDQGQFSLSRAYGGDRPYTFLATQWAWRAWQARALLCAQGCELATDATLTPSMPTAPRTQSAPPAPCESEAPPPRTDDSAPQEQWLDRYPTYCACQLCLAAQSRLST